MNDNTENTTSLATADATSEATSEAIPEAVSSPSNAPEAKKAPRLEAHRQQLKSRPAIGLHFSKQERTYLHEVTKMLSQKCVEITQDIDHLQENLGDLRESCQLYSAQSCSRGDGGKV